MRADERQPVNHPLRVVIADRIPSHNKGEMAILGGIAEGLHMFGDVQLSILTDRPDEDGSRYGNEAKAVDLEEPVRFLRNFGSAESILKSFAFLCQHCLFVVLYKALGTSVLSLMRSSIWREYIESDLILIGHNSSYGPGGKIGMPIYFYHLYLPIIARILKKPTAMVGGSIRRTTRFRGPIKLLYGLSLGNMDLITFREETSLDILAEYCVENGRVFVLPDPAFLLEPADESSVQEMLSRERLIGKKPLIGLTVTRSKAAKAFESEGGLSSYDRHNEGIARLIDLLTDELNAYVVFIPHCTGPSPDLDDRLVASDILELVDNADRVTIMTKEYSASELKGIISRLDILLGERIHSVVNALSMCIPALALIDSRDPRIDIFRQVDLGDMAFPIENLNVNGLFLKVREMLASSAEIRSRLSDRKDAIRDGAMKNFVLLRELIGIESSSPNQIGSSFGRGPPANRSKCRESPTNDCTRRN